MREKLIELLENDDCPLLYVLGENVGSLADYLIANGVTIPVRCKHCVNTCDGNNGLICLVLGTGTSSDGWCYKGERKDNDNQQKT